MIVIGRVGQCRRTVGYAPPVVRGRLGPRAHHVRRRADGDLHSSALRNTFNRMLGYLFRCLHERKIYSEWLRFRRHVQSRPNTVAC
ncbi:hypothetical protein ACQPYK_22815 [Streptosporangium sp. CA-135522]|uniref:hypothetical protein n=1 Tax=Streptosporangium sp. CA-135522 TaxID=3240072 RepID=UPI003D9356E8